MCHLWDLNLGPHTPTGMNKYPYTKQTLIKNLPIHTNNNYIHIPKLYLSSTSYPSHCLTIPTQHHFIHIMINVISLPTLWIVIHPHHHHWHIQHWRMTPWWGWAVAAGNKSSPVEWARTIIGSRHMLVFHFKNRNTPQRTPLEYEGEHHSDSSSSPEIRTRIMLMSSAKMQILSAINV